MNNLEFFLNLSPNKINAILIDKENKNKIFNKDFNFDNNFNDIKLVINNLNKILKDLIIEVEKKISNPINTINPDIFVVFCSNPYPKSIIKCLISLRIWNVKDQIIPRQINLPKNDNINNLMNS